jgi:hypothetical protein
LVHRVELYLLALFFVTLQLEHHFLVSVQARFLLVEVGQPLVAGGGRLVRARPGAARAEDGLVYVFESLLEFFFGAVVAVKAELVSRALPSAGGWREPQSHRTSARTS